MIVNLDNPKKIATRDGYGEALVELGSKNKEVVVLCCDLTESTRALPFKQKYPERFFEVGVAEQNLAGIAAGLALWGKIPFMNSYAVFSPGRNWDQIRVSICYSQANVKIAGCHAGVTVGPDGATHQALEDIACMRVLPNMIVIVPCDSVEAKKATQAAAQIRGPVYLRFGREKMPVITQEETPFAIGKAQIFREGNDATVIACGALVYEALVAAQQLEKEGISVCVVNCPTIKPLDAETLTAVAKKTGCIVTAEEHQVTGGLGGAVTELLSEHCPVPIARVGMLDHFGESGEAAELMKKYGMTAEAIVSAVLNVLQKKKQIGIIQIQNPTEQFYLEGKYLKNLIELVVALETISDELYQKHVGAGKNDFANWIEHVFKDLTLAGQVRGAGDRKEMAQIILQQVY